MNSLKRTIEIKWKTVLEVIFAVIMISNIWIMRKEVITLKENIKELHPIEITISSNGGAVNE